MSGFSCEIGDKTFSNFTYTPNTAGTGVASPANGVAVTPIPPPAGQWGFTFTGIWNSGTNGTGDAGLSYDVAVTSGAALIDSASLTLTGSLTGTGSTGTVGETVCENAACSISDLLNVSLAGPGSDSVNPLSSGPVPMVHISKNIDAMSSGSGTASISVVTNTVDQITTPEPASLVLLGSALVGFGAFRRRRKSS